MLKIGINKEILIKLQLLDTPIKENRSIFVEEVLQN